MADNEVSMMMSVYPGAMTGFSALTANLSSINNIFMQGMSRIDDNFGIIDSSIIATGALVIQLGAQAMSAFGEFEQGMKIVQMVSGQTASDIDYLSQKANQFSVQYRTDIDQITEGLQTLGRAGLNSASEQSEVLENGLTTAKLEGRELNSVLEELIQNTALLGGDLKSPNFGENTEYVNDLLVATSMTAPIDTHDVSETLKYSGGIAAAAGANIESESGKEILEDYMGAIAAFAQKGVTGSIAGTALRAFFNKPATQDSSVVDALATIHLKPEYLWEDDEETMKPISEQIDIITKQMDKLDVSTMDRLQIWSKIVGGKMGQQMMKLESGDIKELTKDIQAADEASDLAAGSMKTFQANIKAAQESGALLQRNVGNVLVDYTNPFLEFANKVMSFLNQDFMAYPLALTFIGFMGAVAIRIKRIFSQIKAEISEVWQAVKQGENVTVRDMRGSTKTGKRNSLVNLGIEGAETPEDYKRAFEKHFAQNAIDKYKNWAPIDIAIAEQTKSWSGKGGDESFQNTAKEFGFSARHNDMIETLIKQNKMTDEVREVLAQKGTKSFKMGTILSSGVSVQDWIENEYLKVQQQINSGYRNFIEENSRLWEVSSEEVSKNTERVKENTKSTEDDTQSKNKNSKASEEAKHGVDEFTASLIKMQKELEAQENKNRDANKKAIDNFTIQEGSIRDFTHSIIDIESKDFVTEQNQKILEDYYKKTASGDFSITTREAGKIDFVPPIIRDILNNPSEDIDLDNLSEYTKKMVNKDINDALKNKGMDPYSKEGVSAFNSVKSKRDKAIQVINDYQNNLKSFLEMPYLAVEDIIKDKKNYTVANIKSILDEQGVSYSSKDNKPDLAKKASWFINAERGWYFDPNSLNDMNWNDLRKLAVENGVKGNIKKKDMIAQLIPILNEKYKNEVEEWEQYINDGEVNLRNNETIRNQERSVQQHLDELAQQREESRKRIQNAADRGSEAYSKKSEENLERIRRIQNTINVENIKKMQEENSYQNRIKKQVEEISARLNKTDKSKTTLEKQVEEPLVDKYAMRIRRALAEYDPSLGKIQTGGFTISGPFSLLGHDMNQLGPKYMHNQAGNPLFAYLDDIPDSDSTFGISSSLRGMWNTDRAGRFNFGTKEVDGELRSVTKGLRGFGNGLLNMTDQIGGPFMIAIMAASTAIQMWEKAFQDYCEDLKEAGDRLKEAYSKRDSAENDLRQSFRDKYPDATDEEIEQKILDTYATMGQNMSNAINNGSEEWLKKTAQAAEEQKKYEMDTEKDDGSMKEVEEEVDDAVKLEDAIKENTGALYVATGELSSTMGQFVNKANDSWWGVDGWTGAITDELGAAQDGLTSALNEDTNIFNTAWGHSGGSKFTDNNEFLLTASQQDENYAGYTEMAGLMLEDFKDARGDWKNGLRIMMGSDVDVLNNIISQKGRDMLQNLAGKDSKGNTIPGSIATMTSENNLRLQQSMKNDSKTWKSLAKEIAKYENKNKKKYGGKNTTKKIEGLITKLNTSMGSHFSDTQILQAAYLQQMQDMYQVAQNTIVPIINTNMQTAAQTLVQATSTADSTDSTSQGTYGTQSVASVIAGMVAQIAMAQAAEATYNGILMQDPTKLKTVGEKETYKMAQEATDANDFMKKAANASYSGGYTAIDWGKFASGDLGGAIYGVGPNASKKAMNDILTTYGAGLRMTTYGEDSKTARDKVAAAIQEWREKGSSSQAIYESLAHITQDPKFLKQLEETYLASGNEGDGSGSGSGSGSGNKDKDNTGTRKERVDLVLCNRKQIPKLNVNLFKKPPSFTILNKNFKLRDVKINSEDKPKAIMSAIKNSFIDIQKRTDPKIIQDENSVYDPLEATEGTDLPSGSSKTNTTR